MINTQSIAREVARQVVDAQEQWMMDEISKIVGDEIDLFKTLVEILKENRSSKLALCAVKGFLDRHGIDFVSTRKRNDYDYSSQCNIWAIHKGKAVGHLAWREE